MSHDTRSLGIAFILSLILVVVASSVPYFLGVGVS